MHTAYATACFIFGAIRAATLIGGGLWMMISAKRSGRWFWPVIGTVLVVLGAHTLHL